MKTKAMATTLFFAASLFTAGGALAAEESRTGENASKYGTSSSDMTRSGSEQGSRQMAGTAESGKESRTIQAADDLKNFTVQDTRGEKIGKVSQVLVDLESGRIGYAVVSSGGFLGMGGEKYIVPFSALKSGEAGETLTLDIQKDQLQQAPKGDIEQVGNRETGREIHQFYGVAPYWEEGGSQTEKQSPEAGPMEQEMERQELEPSEGTGM